MTMNASGSGYELRFRSLFSPGRGFAFPCDAQGRIAIDTLSPAAKASYQRARQLVGCELCTPEVLPISNESNTDTDTPHTRPAPTGDDQDDLGFQITVRKLPAKVQPRGVLAE